MQKYEAIEYGIAKNDVKALREAIGSICYTNRDFSNGEFEEAVKYVESKGIQLKDKVLKGNPTISNQKSDFTDEDFAKAIYELKKNFCDERINDVKTIGMKLYGKKVSDTKATVSKPVVKKNRVAERSISTGTLPNQQSHQQKNKIPMVIGLVAIIAIIIIILITK